jgi:cystathionine beta-lyase
MHDSPFAVYDIEALRRMRRAKWALETEKYGAAVAEMDFSPAPPIISALVDAARRGDMGYPHPQALESASVSLKDWLKERHEWTVSVSDLVTVGGLIHALEAFLLHFVSSTSVVVPTPAYPPFLSVPRGLGLEVLESPMLCDDGQWRLDLDDIDKAFSSGARVLILCNPHNPTGTVFTREELVALSEIVDRHRGRVFSDEIHAPLVYAPGAGRPSGRTHVPYASVSSAATEHTVTGVSATKAWNIGGMSCAHMIISEQDRLTANRLAAVLAHSASTLGLWATAAAYREGGPWLRDVVSYLNGNRHRLADLVDKHLPGVKYRVPDASYLAWLDFRATEWSDEPARHARSSAGVSTNEGTDYGAPGQGFLRLNFATPAAVLEEIVGALGRTLPFR